MLSYILSLGKVSLYPTALRTSVWLNWVDHNPNPNSCIPNFLGLGYGTLEFGFGPSSIQLLLYSSVVSSLASHLPCVQVCCVWSRCVHVSHCHHRISATGYHQSRVRSQGPSLRLRTQASLPSSFSDPLFSNFYFLNSFLSNNLFFYYVSHFILHFGFGNIKLINFFRKFSQRQFV